MLRFAPSHRDANSWWPSASSDRTNVSQCGRSTPGAASISSYAPSIGRYPSNSRHGVVTAWMSVGDFNWLQPSNGPQVERQREVRVALLEWVAYRTGRVADVEEPREAPAFRFVRVDRKDVKAPSPRMRDVVDAPAHRGVVPRIQNVEHERRMHRNHRMQAARRLPCPV